MNEKELDRLLKDRFFQALNSKWQRKLAAPKPNETFNELYDRARTLEKHDKQISATAAIKGDAKSSSDRSKQPQNTYKSFTNPKNQKTSQDQAPQTFANRGFKSNRPTGPGSQRGSMHNQPFRGGCFLCGGPHLARACPHPHRGTHSEAPGRSSNESRSAQVTATPTVTTFTEDELVKMLGECRLKKEEALLAEKGSQCDTVSSTNKQTSDAVGPTLVLQVLIEGVQVEAMVDMGSQSTVVSQAVLHEVGKRLHQEGREMPQLRVLTVRLYGKDCGGEKRELDITAEVSLTIESDGKAVTAPVFVQPDSEQPCLLGMNIAPALGLKFLDANGLPLKESSQEQTTVMVCLTKASTLSGRKGKFLETKVDSIVKPGTEILFEPNAEPLRALGLSAQESLLCVQKDGTVLIPLQNFKQNTVNIEAGFELGGAEPLQTEFLMQQAGCSLNFPDEVICSKVTTRRQAKWQADRKSKIKAMLNLPGENLTPEQFQQLEEKLMDNTDVFAVDESELGHTTIVKHSIDTGDHPPIKQSPRRTPFIYREKITQLVNNMLKQQVVKPSSSAWASPVVLVPKKDGNLRFCVDYRKINITQ